MKPTIKQIAAKADKVRKFLRSPRITPSEGLFLALIRKPATSKIRNTLTISEGWIENQPDDNQRVWDRPAMIDRPTPPKNKTGVHLNQTFRSILKAKIRPTNPTMIARR